MFVSNEFVGTYPQDAGEFRTAFPRKLGEFRTPFPVRRGWFRSFGRRSPWDWRISDGGPPAGEACRERKPNFGRRSPWGLAGLGELGITVNLVMLDESKLIDDR